MTSDGLTERIQYRHAEWVSIHPYFWEHLNGILCRLRCRRSPHKELWGPRHQELPSTWKHRGAGPEIFQLVICQVFNKIWCLGEPSFTWNHTLVILGEFSTPMTFEFLGRQWTWNPRRTFAIFLAILSNNLILGNPHPKQGLNISGCLKNHSVDDVSLSKKMISRGMAKQFPVSIHVSFVEIKKREFEDPNSPQKKCGVLVIEHLRTSLDCRKL